MAKAFPLRSLCFPFVKNLCYLHCNSPDCSQAPMILPAFSAFLRALLVFAVSVRVNNLYK